MKKLITFFILLASALLNAQTEQKSIELPDFVITGRQNVEVQSAVKKKPELISTLSKEFFTPQYSPEELPLLISSVPKTHIPYLDTDEENLSGKLFIGVGRYSLPVGNLQLSKSFKNFIVTANAWGSDIRNYIQNSGFNSSCLSLTNNFFIPTDSDFLAGTILKLSGDYSRNTYKFFGSITPLSERKTNFGNINLSIDNHYGRIINFNFDFNADFLSMPNDKFEENKMTASGILEIHLNNFSIGAIGRFQRQLIENNLSGIGKYENYSGGGFVEINPTKSVFLKLGVDYYANSNSSFFTPNAALKWKLADGLLLLVNLHPKAEIYSIRDFLLLNPYMVNSLTDNLFSKTKFHLISAIQYSYEKVFAFTFYGKLSNADNYLYFEDKTKAGFFNVQQSSGVNSSEAGIDLIVFPNQFGFFQGGLKYNSVKDGNGNMIPYQPSFFANAVYGFDFNFGLGFKTSYQFASNFYKDILNTVEIEQYHNLSLQISYKVYQNLSVIADFQNILNRSNFVWHQYQGKPLDIILGVEYRW
jgi:hypothetical protein